MHILYIAFLFLFCIILEKIAILKKGIGIESERIWKQVRDQIVWKKVEDTAQGLLKNGNKF